MKKSSVLMSKLLILATWVLSVARTTAFLPASNQNQHGIKQGISMSYMLQPSSVATIESSSWIVAETDGGLADLIFPGMVLSLAIGAFVYANAVYTPEIVAANEQMRLESRELEMQKLLSVVQKHIDDDLDLEELRSPLETTFGMSLNEYIQKVESDTEALEYTKADQNLAKLLRTNTK